MVTIFLEIINTKSPQVGFYHPAGDQFSAYPRTVNGVKKAISKMKKFAINSEFIEDFRIACYESKKEYWNDKPFIGYISKETIVSEF